MTDEQADLIAHALAEPRRRLILKQIGARQEPTPCAELLLLHDIGAPTLSRHLKELQTAGLIKSTKNGKCLDMVIQRDVLQAYVNHLTEL